MTDTAEPPTDDLVVGKTPEQPGPSWLLGLRRDRRRALVAGVAAGIAARVGIDPLWIRVGFLVTSLAGGAGVVVYLAGWLLLEESDEVEVRRDVGPTNERTLGVVAVIVGILLALRGLGLWFGDALVAPLVLAGLGAAFIWDRSDVAERRRLGALAQRIPGQPLADVVRLGGFLRLAVGGLIVMGGLAGIITAATTSEPLRVLPVTVAALIFGVALIVGPSLTSLRRTVDDERRLRIRSEERAEVAAHLHDSVLQTLTLIQRSDAPADVVRLARSQERDLRAWLTGRDADEVPTRLRAALEATAARVEDRYGASVEVVVVGDTDLDDRLVALVAATAEALANAARHSGAPRVSVYAEVDDDRIDVAVRDEGVGFDPVAIGVDRRGLRESVMARVERHGGTAVIDSQPGEGTEIVLTLPRRPA